MIARIYSSHTSLSLSRKKTLSDSFTWKEDGTVWKYLIHGLNQVMTETDSWQVMTAELWTQTAQTSLSKLILNEFFRDSSTGEESQKYFPFWYTIRHIATANCRVFCCFYIAVQNSFSYTWSESYAERTETSSFYLSVLLSSLHFPSKTEKPFELLLLVARSSSHDNHLLQQLNWKFLFGTFDFKKKVFPNISIIDRQTGKSFAKWRKIAFISFIVKHTHAHTPSSEWMER